MLRFVSYEWDMGTILSMAYVVTIATFNLMLGFAVALCFNRGPKRLREGVGARWRYRIAALRYGERAILDSATCSSDISSADADRTAAESLVELVAPPSAKETIVRLKNEIDAFEQAVNAFEDSLVNPAVAAGDYEQRLEDVQQHTQAFLDKVNRTINHLASASGDSGEPVDETSRLREHCDELWKEINDRLGKSFHLKMGDSEQATVPLLEFARCIRLALEISRKNIDDAVAILS